MAIYQCVQIGEEGLDEFRAAHVAGGFERVGEAGAVEGGLGLVERLAELNGLEIQGLFIDAGGGEGLEPAPTRT